MSHFLTRHFLSATMIALGITLTACAPQYIPNPPRGFEGAAVSLAHKVYYAPGKSELSPSEAQRLDDFLDQNLALRGSPVTLQLVGGMQRTPVNEVTQRLNTAGFRDVKQMASTMHDSSIIVTINSNTALPRSCSGLESMSGSIIPPGCMNDLNLAKMVAKASDLTRGRTMGPAIGSRVLAPIRDEEGNGANALDSVDTNFGL